MAVDKGGRNNKRQMRAFQKLAADAIGSLALIEGDGINFTGDTINVDLKDTDPGLSFHTTGLQVLLGTNPGLTLASGLAITTAAGQPFSLSGGLTLDLTTNGGLEIASNALGINLDTDPALALGAGGLSVEVEAGEPFDKVGGLSLELTTGGGLETISSELGINLDTDPGLALSATGLIVDLDTNPGLALGAGGIKVDVVSPGELALTASGLDHAFPPGRRTEIDVRTTAATLLQVSAGDFIVIDSTVSGSQSIRLPDPTDHDGESIMVKLVGGVTISFLIIAQYLNDYTGLIEGIPTTGAGTSFLTVAVPDASYVITSDGTDWWITENYLDYQTMTWRRYEMAWADRENESGATMEVPLFSVTVDQLNSVFFMGCVIHTAQGWFTFNSGVLDVRIDMADSNTGSPHDLLASHQLFPQTIGTLTGRSLMDTPDLVATGTITVKAVLTVSGGTTDITDVAQGRSTVWILWGNFGPRFA